MQNAIKNYITITAGYWGFTLTDGAIRMLVVLYFHSIGYSPFEVASLFLFYEFFGMITNLIGGWAAIRLGLNVTMHMGMALQITALAMLAFADTLLSVAYVMFAQALSGIAKDLNKMSAKASVKTLLASSQDSRLFQWVAILTGSKNTLKGAGFFLGGMLLEVFGFSQALLILAVGLLILLVITMSLLPNNLGKAKNKPKFSQVFSNTPAINWLAAARFFLFASRDIWFVVALPVFLFEHLHWSFTQVGSFIALWIIGYGVIQSISPQIIRNHQASGSTAKWLALLLALVPIGIAVTLMQTNNVTATIIIGLMIFGIVFALNSSFHSYLILAYSHHDKVAMNVGFYYMANAGGRLTGTVISGLAYQSMGLIGCLWVSAGFIIVAGALSMKLPNDSTAT
ncbi:MAG: organoarsenical effux MFS transporter ArsJ [Thiotrichaceae bacterium]|nr:organoarsenical effux MFS transporter ArsJ [Thiotrichaceae bacterium]